ncbi:MAG: hypothetical protein FD138_4114 [Planctomycetota bacterium]|nr:MAG: hypothetical protein FD138_4114 [Planctomycetota bacterium]
MRQFDFDIDLISRAETEVRGPFLAGAVPVADADLARADPRRRVALSSRVDVNLGTDSHPVDSVLPFDADLQPVAASSLVAKQQRAGLDPPVGKKNVELAIAIEVARRTRGHVDDFLFFQNFREQLAGAALLAVFLIGKIIQSPNVFAESRQTVSDAEVLVDQWMRLTILELDDAHQNVWQSVVVEVLKLDMRSLHQQRLQAGCFGDVLEGWLAVLHAAMQVQPDWDRRNPRRLEVMSDDDVRQAVSIDVGNAGSGGSVFTFAVWPTKDVACARSFAEVSALVVQQQAMFAGTARKKNVWPTVGIEVRRERAQPAEPNRQARRYRNILEAMPPSIAIQHRADFHFRRVVLLARQQIEQPVAVEVERRDAASFIQRRACAALLRDVGELSAAIVPKERIRRRKRWIAFLPVGAI